MSLLNCSSSSSNSATEVGWLLFADATVALRVADGDTVTLLNAKWQAVVTSEGLELTQVTQTSNKAVRAKAARDDVINELRHRKLDVEALSKQQAEHFAELGKQLEEVRTCVAVAMYELLVKAIQLIVLSPVDV